MISELKLDNVLLARLRAQGLRGGVSVQASGELAYTRLDEDHRRKRFRADAKTIDENFRTLAAC